MERLILDYHHRSFTLNNVVFICINNGRLVPVNSSQIQNMIFRNTTLIKQKEVFDLEIIYAIKKSKRGERRPIGPTADGRSSSLAKNDIVE